MQKVKEYGRYRVLAPLLPRHRTRKYADISATSPEEAVEKFRNIIAERYDLFWFFDGDFEIIKVWREPVFYTDDEIEASAERIAKVHEKWARLRADRRRG